MIKVFKAPYILRWIFPRRVWGFSSSKSIFLTFDDGPTKELTSWILNLLREKGIRATFFCVGSNASNNPELMKELLADGHVVGNHTMRHETARIGNKEQYMASINEAQPFTSAKFFRPPHGKLPMTFTRKIGQNYKILMWSWLSYDFDKTVPIERILRKAERQIKPGDIIVLHDNAKIEERAKELFPKLIDLLLQKGYTFDVI